MSLDAKITRQLGPNYVQVDITNKNEPYRYFKVPKQNADSFVTNFKKQDKKNSYMLNGAFALAVVAGVCLAGMFTKNIKSGMTKFLTKMAGGVLASSAVLYGSGSYIDKQDQKFAKKYRAEEIYYET